jgi:hypothetical protein
MPTLLGFLAACLYSPPEVPGQLANPKLAQLINTSLQQEAARMVPSNYPGLTAEASKNTLIWFTEIREVVARCRYGPRNDSKFNLLVYDITLRTGAVIESVYTGRRCLYGMELPLVMRVRFENGQVVEALTDGRELKQSVQTVKGELLLFAETIIRTDWRRNPARYFPPNKTESQILDEWKMK